MKRSYTEELKEEEEDNQEINEASASVLSSDKLLNKNLNHLYSIIPNSSRNERGKKLRLEKAFVSCSEICKIFNLYKG